MTNLERFAIVTASHREAINGTRDIPPEVMEHNERDCARMEAIAAGSEEWNRAFVEEYLERNIFALQQTVNLGVQFRHFALALSQAEVLVHALTLRAKL